MEYQGARVKTEPYATIYTAYPAPSNKHRWAGSLPLSRRWTTEENWGYRCDTPDSCDSGSARTPGYIMIQPRSSHADARDHRMLVPITKKRKGNNRYGQSGSHRCQRCQKGKRKCVYNSKSEPCQRCVERGFECGAKLPTPRKQAAMALMQANGYWKDPEDYPSRSSSSSDNYSPRSDSYSPKSDSYSPRSDIADTPVRYTFQLLPELPEPPISTHRHNVDEEALSKLWANLAI